MYVKKACVVENPITRTEKYCAEVGHDILILGKVIDGIISNYHQQECLVQSR
jgi:hypothetical protein